MILHTYRIVYALISLFTIFTGVDCLDWNAHR
jgi:hypothetical protein